MAIVTFPIELGGSGLVVSDDTDPTTGLRNGGYLTRFVPALQQTVAVAGFVVGLASDAADSEAAASGFATAASASASSAAANAALTTTLYDQFDDRYLGPKAANPTVDNDGNALLVGAMYFNTTAMETRVWNGTSWQSASVNGGTVNSLTVTGAFEYQGTFTGGAGVMNIGEGQLVKDTAGNFGVGVTPSSSWGSTQRALDISGASTAHVVAQVNGISFGSNYYIDEAGVARYSTTGQFANRFQLSNGDGNYRWLTAPSGAAGNSIPFTVLMTLSPNGNWLLGTTTEVGRAHIANSGNTLVRINSTNGQSPELSLFSTGIADWRIRGGEPFSVIRDVTELVRVSPAGYFKATNNGTFFHGAAASVHELVSNQANITLGVSNTNLSGTVQNIRSDLTSGSAGLHFLGVVNGVSQFIVETDGAVKNTTNAYGAISDPKMKDIIGPKASTWEKTKAYEWIEYYLKSDTDHVFKMMGLNAADADLVSPGVIDETPDLIEVQKVRDVPTQIPRLDESDNPIFDDEGNVVYDEIMVQEEYTEWEPNGEVTLSAKYSVISMQYHRTTQECQHRIENLESAKAQTDDVIQQLMGRVAALESASA